jgi:hypothetical protein
MKFTKITQTLILFTIALSEIQAQASAQTVLARCTPQSHDFEYVEVVIEKTAMRTPMYFTSLRVIMPDDSKQVYSGGIVTEEALDSLKKNGGQLSFVAMNQSAVVETEERIKGAIMVRLENTSEPISPYLIQIAMDGAVQTFNCK